MKKTLIKSIILFSCLIFIFILANNALAFTDTYKDFLKEAGRIGTYDVNGQGAADFIDIKIGYIITVIISFIGVVFLALVFYAGFQWMTAGGNEEKVAKSRKMVINGTIGVGITLLAFILSNALFTYFNYKFLNQATAPETQPPPGFEEVGCSNDAQCRDRLGPVTRQPMFCLQLENANQCAECGQGHSCPNPNIFNCNESIGFCIARQGVACSSYSYEQIDQCIYQQNCIWNAEHGNRGWERGRCDTYNEDTHHCGQCPENTPYCHNFGNNNWQCVECEENSDCWGPNWCTIDNACAF